jgi:hypothetical protein
MIFLIILGARDSSRHRSRERSWIVGSGIEVSSGQNKWKPDIPLPAITIAQKPANVIARVASVYRYAGLGNPSFLLPSEKVR